MISTQTLQKEEILVIKYQTTKCSKAFGDLYEIFYSQIYDYARKIVSNDDDAFDITQEAFIKAAQEMHKLRNPITFRFWLFKVTKNMCIKKHKLAKKVSYESYIEDFISEDYSTSEAIAKDQKLETMSIALSSLSEEDKNLLMAKYSSGKSIKEIMELTNLGSSAIKMKLMRARSKMTTEMSLMHN